MTVFREAPSDDDQRACSHPWFLVTCGECGASLEEVRHHLVEGAAPSEPADLAEVPDAPVAARPPGGGGGQSLFIVARGQTELLEQLRAVLGEAGSVRVIEDRRRASRQASEDEAQRVRTELRRRLREDEEPPPA